MKRQDVYKRQVQIHTAEYLLCCCLNQYIVCRNIRFTFTGIDLSLIHICTFEEAARLAAYYSKNRNSEKVEIDYIQRKHVKKPNAGKPGFVIYHTNYSMMIEPDIEGIEPVK